uniref:proline-rich AKT1 substrate 1 isoform X2 n=1 Tax=Myxine glutinosa TaxID=7769 RepID=UPI00358E8AF9
MCIHSLWPFSLGPLTTCLQDYSTLGLFLSAGFTQPLHVIALLAGLSLHVYTTEALNFLILHVFIVLRWLPDSLLVHVCTTLPAQVRADDRPHSTVLSRAKKKFGVTIMATDMADNHRESWDALVHAAERYRRGTGHEVSVLTAFAPRDVTAGPGGKGLAYLIHGGGLLGDAARHYLDGIALWHRKALSATIPLPPKNHGSPSPSARPQGPFSTSYPSIYGRGVEGDLGGTTSIVPPPPSALPLLVPPDEGKETLDGMVELNGILEYDDDDDYEDEEEEPEKHREKGDSACLPWMKIVQTMTASPSSNPMLKGKALMMVVGVKTQVIAPPGVCTPCLCPCRCPSGATACLPSFRNRTSKRGLPAQTWRRSPPACVRLL